MSPAETNQTIDSNNNIPESEPQHKSWWALWLLGGLILLFLIMIIILRGLCTDVWYINLLRLNDKLCSGQSSLEQELTLRDGSIRGPEIAAGAVSIDNLSPSLQLSINNISNQLANPTPGPIGATGAVGANGLQGATGATGPMGPAGPTDPCVTAGTYFCQNGNNFGATAVLGTNDLNSLAFETGGTTQANIAVGGATTFQNSVNSTNAFQIQNTLATTIFDVDSTNGRVGINTSTPAEALDVYGNEWVHNHAAIGADSTLGPGSLITPIAVGPSNIPILPMVPIPANRVLAVQETISGIPTAVAPVVYSGTGSEIYVSGDTDPGASLFTGSYSSAEISADNPYDYPGLSGASSLAVHMGLGDLTLGAGQWGTFYNMSDATVTGSAGVNGTIVNVGSGTITNGFGLGSYAFNTYDGTIENAGGLFVGYGNTGSGTIETLSGVQVLSPVNSGSGSIDSVFGLFVQDQASFSGTYPTQVANILTTGAAANSFGGNTFLNTENSAALTSNFASPYNPAGRWVSSPSNNLPTPLKNMGYGYANGYIYLTGGDDGVSSATTSVYYSKIGAGGSLSWSSTTPLPVPRSGHKSFIQNGYIYVVGGEDGVGPLAVADVYFARLNADGTVGSWKTTTSLPGVRALYGGAQNNGYMYVVAGTDNFVNYSTVFYARPNPDGSISSWTTSATPLPSSWKASDAVVANNFLYYLDLGGYGVKYASLNPDGSNNAWSTATTTPTYGTFNHTAFVNSGNLYRVGGDLLGSPQAISSTAPLKPDGDLGVWSEHESDMATGIEQQAAVVTDGYVFLIGGTSDGSNTLDTVQMSSTRRVGVAGALDLTFNPETSTSLTDGGAATTLTAGNTNIIGGLQVYGDTSVKGVLTALNYVNLASDVQLGADINFDAETAHVIKVDDSTSAATPGAYLSIQGADGNGAAGGNVIIQAGSGTTDGDVLLNPITGNVGIHNAAPAFSLHVGDVSIADGTTLLRLEDTNSVCDLNANAGGPACGSDETLKKNIVDLSLSALEKVNALRVVQYNWQTDAEGDAAQTGFIAQEVADVLPDLVKDGTWKDGSTRKFLTQSGLLPYLVKAIQEQQEEIDGLKNTPASVSVDVLGELAKANAVTLNGDLIVNGLIQVSSNNTGLVKIPAGELKLKVNLPRTFGTKPSIVVSPNDFIDGAYRTTNVTINSFEIELNKTQAEDVEFNWQAF